MTRHNGARLAEAIEACSRMAQRELDTLLDRLDLDKPVECKQALLVAYPAIVEKYGAMAAAAAAECYAGEREAVLGVPYQPVTAQPVDAGAMRAKVRFAMRYLFEEVADGEPDEQG